MSEKNLLDLKVSKDADEHAAAVAIIARVHELRVEMKRLQSSAHIAYAFAVVVESFKKTLNPVERAFFESEVRGYTAVYDAARRMAKDGISVDEAAGIVKKEIA